MEYRFLEPVDVLYLRGNKLFGDAGAHGEALMPPWPSLAAGSLRSRMLVDARCNPGAYGRCRAEPPEPLKSVLGTPTRPGSFRVSLFTLGRRQGVEIEPLLSLPADVVVRKSGKQWTAETLRPCRLKAKIQCGYPLPSLPLVRTQEPFKPERGMWLSKKGLGAYLAGEPIPTDGLVPRSRLWEYDTRLGIALNAVSQTAETGRIYTAETVSLQPETGFLVGVSGADGLVPREGLLRLGGDGRGARITACSPRFPEVPWNCIAREKRFRFILVSPGLFLGGWLLPGCRMEDGELLWEHQGMRARLAAASVGRQEVVSGWDLALRRPKTALRAVPPGSVYWLEDFEGEMEALRRVVETGLWDSANLDELGPRRAEGFNGVIVAAWPKT